MDRLAVDGFPKLGALVVGQGVEEGLAEGGVWIEGAAWARAGGMVGWGGGVGGFLALGAVVRSVVMVVIVGGGGVVWVGTAVRGRVVVVVGGVVIASRAFSGFEAPSRGSRGVVVVYGFGGAGGGV